MIHCKSLTTIASYANHQSILFSLFHNLAMLASSLACHVHVVQSIPAPCFTGLPTTQTSVCRKNEGGSGITLLSISPQAKPRNTFMKVTGILLVEVPSTPTQVPPSTYQVAYLTFHHTQYDREGRWLVPWLYCCRTVLFIKIRHQFVFVKQKMRHRQPGR